MRIISEMEKSEIKFKIRRKILFAANGCWVWLGEINNKGYGKICVLGSRYYAHRISYTVYVGEIQDTLELDHGCRVTYCVNPDHLEPVTHRVNILRGIGPIPQKSAQTHCIHGHLLEGWNLMIRPNGCRSCRICHYRLVYARRNRLNQKHNLYDTIHHAV